MCTLLAVCNEFSHKPYKYPRGVTTVVKTSMSMACLDVAPDIGADGSAVVDRKLEVVELPDECAVVKVVVELPDECAVVKVVVDVVADEFSVVDSLDGEESPGKVVVLGWRRLFSPVVLSGHLAAASSPSNESTTENSSNTTSTTTLT